MSNLRERPWQLDAQSAALLAEAVHGNPFSILGSHDTPQGRVIRSFLPGALKVEVLRRSDGAVLSTLEAASEAGLFENLVPERVPYRLRIQWPDAVQETEDPYSFGLLLDISPST
jgi:1,4-alpha-glucan branching enzyme